jgi:hypothetical protein
MDKRNAIKKRALMNNASEMYDSIIGTQKAIRENCEEYIKIALKENNGHIDFNDYDINEFVSVPYDGGNHPEYASNCFSVVNGVFMHKDGYICLDTEDCDCYPLSDVDWDDVYNVAEYINKLLGE